MSRRRAVLEMNLSDFVFFGVGLVLFFCMGYWGPARGGNSAIYWTLGAAFMCWGVAGRVLSVRAMASMKRGYEKKAMIDELTGALSRLRIIEALEREMRGATRKGTTLSIIMIEALNIIKINEQFDRLEGDSTLAAMAMAAQSCLRETDYLGRSGGLAFCAVLPETSQEDAGLVMLRIRDSLDGIIRSHPKGEVRAVSRLISKTWDGAEDCSTFIARAESGLFRSLGAE
jgi:diguanylate cyclase (GGDEF)-like protein